MQFDTLGSRMKQYEQNHDSTLMRRVPIIVRLDGRGFSRVCSKLQKPYEPLLLEAMAETMLYMATQTDNAYFAYAQSDEITIVFRNDQSNESQPWYANRVQKIVSITSSLATLGFNKAISKISPSLPLCGEAIFDARVFAVPNISEAVNNLIWRQQDCMRNSIMGASQTLFTKKFGHKTALKMIHKKSSKDKLKMMQEELGIDFEEEYPSSYRMGVAAYKVPMVFPTKDGMESTRKKWIIDWELPNFVLDRDFVHNILLTGADVFREESLLMLGDKKE